MKSLSFNVRFLGATLPVAGMIPSYHRPFTLRNRWIVVPPLRLFNGRSKDPPIDIAAANPPATGAVGSEGDVGRLLVRNQRDGFGSTFIAVYVGYEEDDLMRPWSPALKRDMDSRMALRMGHD